MLIDFSTQEFLEQFTPIPAAHAGSFCVDRAPGACEAGTGLGEGPLALDSFGRQTQAPDATHLSGDKLHEPMQDAIATEGARPAQTRGFLDQSRGWR